MSIQTTIRDAFASGLLEDYYDILLERFPQAVIEFDDNGRARFQAKPLAGWFAANCSLNNLWSDYQNGRIPGMTDRDLMDFYRDIGYTLCGFLDIFDGNEGWQPLREGWERGQTANCFVGYGKKRA